jgi:hypothetical protein
MLYLAETYIKPKAGKRDRKTNGDFGLRDPDRKGLMQRIKSEYREQVETRPVRHLIGARVL